MTGHILNYSIQTNTAVISGDDGNRYTFSGEEWREAGMPTRGMRVDFDVDGSAARDVFSQGRLAGAVNSGPNSATTTQAPGHPGPAGQVNEPAPEPSVGGGGERQSTRRAVMPPLEQLVVPALGVLVLIASIMLATSHWPLGYAIVLAALGLATIGTYFLPPAVQVEVRIAIAALGLIALLIMFKAFGFWMALLAFVAIGAMQIPYRRTLRTPLHTLEWLKALQSGQNIAETLTVRAETDDPQQYAPQPAQPMPGSTQQYAPQPAQPMPGSTQQYAPQPAQPLPGGPQQYAPQPAQPLPGGPQQYAPQPAQPMPGGAVADAASRIQSPTSGSGLQYVGRIGAAAMGAIVLLSFLMPWLTFSSDGGFIGNLTGIVDYQESFSGMILVREATEAAGYDDHLGSLYVVPVIAVAIAVLAVIGIASVALPRAVPVTVGIIGMVVMALLFIGFIVARYEIISSDFSVYLFHLERLAYGRGLWRVDGISLGIGFWTASLAFLLMTVLQLAPRHRN